MTTDAPGRPVAPYRSQAGPGHDGFAQLLHAELTKFHTVRGWVIGMLIAIGVTAGIGIFVAAGGASPSCQSVGSGPAGQGTSCGGPPLVLGPGGEPVTDNFYFVRQPLAGNGSITVRVTSLTSLLPPPGQGLGATPALPGTVPWSKAGIIIGATSLSTPQAYAAMMVTGANGVRMQWNYTGDTPGLTGAVSAASPRWLRLTRDGDTITGYDSTDGASWTVVRVVRLAGLPLTVQAGLFTASPQLPVTAVNIAGIGQGGGGPTASTAVFDRLSRSGAWPASTWTGGYTVGDLAAEAQGLGGYKQVAGRFTVTGQGDVAPAIPDQGEFGSAQSTGAIYLIGTFLGLIVVTVVATMFMTAEYRRGLIRTTLAASPRRGRVLAAKAVMIGAVALTVGVSAAAAAATTCQPGSCAAPVSGVDPAKLSLTGVQAGQVIVAIIGVLAISNEYSTGMIRITLAAMPRRLSVLAAKAALTGGLTLAAATIAVLASVLAGRLILPGHGFTPANGYRPLSLASGPDLRAAGGSVLYLALIALLSLGVATAVRDAAVAIGLVLGLLYLFPLVAGVVSNQHWQRHLEQASPMTAGLYIQVTAGVRFLPLTPWQGLGVSGLWACGALLLGGLILRFRDA